MGDKVQFRYQVIPGSEKLELAENTSTVVLIGKKDSLLSGDVQAVFSQSPMSIEEKLYTSLTTPLSPAEAPNGTDHAAQVLFPEGSDSPITFRVAAITSVASRHNSSARPDCLSSSIKALSRSRGGNVAIFVPCSREESFSYAAAIARSFPTYSAAHGGKQTPRSIQVTFLCVDLPNDEDTVNVSLLNALGEGVRNAASLVDKPCNILHTSAFVDHATSTFEELKAANLPVELLVIAGEDLNEQGFGGLYGVGMAAERPPALVVLSYKPQGASRNVCWVGKGIVYDTGGLSIKSKDGMPGMKRDMGGAAAIVSAFKAAAKCGFKDNLFAVLCLAENAVGSKAQRPDDIVTMYSGKTVEINNTDAEGRLVVGDGVAYAVRHLAPDILLDMCTLTGAQGISTGQRHAAVMCNDDALEALALKSGKLSGDLCFPIPYCPEFFRSEFASTVSDMKNSVRCRGNAQSSCAGQFIANHIADYVNSKPYIHVDMAAPAHTGERGTGYGVALLLAMFHLSA
eukprot:TRINITY_DN8948_c0_g1_i1.p1 TRINITY_DN8948_c0_g1~~TRINITY_DN8948_c0_g1_i1.p1  ORF type:complete len:513 (-),score=85.83 TRINITY_DN8948_c0_g1_i1:66-1604(-)